MALVVQIWYSRAEHRRRDPDQDLHGRFPPPRTALRSGAEFGIQVRDRLPAQEKGGIGRDVLIAKPQIAQQLGGGFDSSASFGIYEEIMSHQAPRRDALTRIAGGALLAGLRRGQSATSKGPHDFIIVEGHYDIWEISARTRLPGEAQRLPLTNFILPRKIEGGQSVVIIAAGGDSLEERDGNELMFEGSMRALDMILSDIEKSNGKASIIRTKADVPTRPNSGKLQFFLDIEGGGRSRPIPNPHSHQTGASRCFASFSGSDPGGCNSHTTAATNSATAAASTSSAASSRRSGSPWSRR
jgi:hypothetical protein